MLIESAGLSFGLDGSVIITAKASSNCKPEAIAMINNSAQLIGNNKPVEIEIKAQRKKRSLDSNAYLWVLIGKLSAKIGIPPVEIYREAIRDIGDNFYVIPLRSDLVDRRKQIWESNGLGWISEVIGESKIDGYTNVAEYYGSSEYDQSQMKRLTDVIVAECQEQGIETDTPDEIAKRLSLWDADERK